MTENTLTESDRKEALKNLRASRREIILAAAARVKTQKKDLEILRRLLGEGEGRTIPELAEGSGLPPAEVLWYVAALKKYGEIQEGKKDGGFYRYLLIKPVAEEETPGS
jgi:predicted transcriptional regulator